MIIAFILILIVLTAGFMTGLFEQYTYSQKQVDKKKYFSISSDDQAVLMLNNHILEEKARNIDGHYYLSLEMVQTYFNEWFYADRNERLLLYAMPTEMMTAKWDSMEYTIGSQLLTEDYVIVKSEGEQLYLAIDFIKKFQNIRLEEYQDPPRLQISTIFDDKVVVDVNKKADVRIEASRKGDILTELLEGEKVTVLEVGEEWTKILTEDAYIGYIENKRIINARTEPVTPVTDVPEMIYTNIEKDYKINLTWHQTTSQAANETLEEMLEGTKGINTISPTWFSIIDNNGTISSIASKAYVDIVHGKGMEVWALIDNFNKEVDSLEVLSYTSKRAFLIQQLMNWVDQLGLDGINVDFEELPEESGEHFEQFIREISIACRQRGIVLSIDNYVPASHNVHYGRDVQGKVADYIIIMGYDEHYSTSIEAGSVASIGFVKNGIENTLKEVPSKKVINAVPFYTRLWIETPKTEEEIAAEDVNTQYIPYKLENQALGMESAKSVLSRNGVVPVWDEETGQNYGTYVKDGITYEIWLEDKDSIQRKIDCMKQYSLGGIASWKLGMEESAIWEIISEYIYS